MEQIDWSKAPEGATHFLPEQMARAWVACWYKIVDGTWFARNIHDCDWYPDYDYQEIFIPMLIEKPKPWIGQGLPPVGTVCEFTSNDGRNWRETSIIFSDDNVILINGYTLYKLEDPDIAFRPIRTPEQIAAEERNKGILEMLDGYSYPNSDIARAVCCYLYDAGYRKFEIIPE